MSDRQYHPLEQDPPTVPILVVVFIVAAAVEAGRFYLHGAKLAAVFPYPKWLAAACIATTLVYNIWNPSQTVVKAIASAFLSESSMFNVLAFTLAAINEIAAAVGLWFAKMTAPA